MVSPASYYQDRIREHSAALETVRLQITRIALLRLILFCGFGLSLYALVKTPSWPLFAATLLLLAAFVALVYVHQQRKDRRILLEKLLFVCGNELGILEHEPNRLPDGRDLLKNEGYLDDLDIFGKGSLFHLLNRTATSHGKAALASLLGNPPLSEDAIIFQQEAVRVLAAQPDRRQLILAHGLIGGEDAGNLFSLMPWLETPTRLIGEKGLMILRQVVLVYNLLSLAVWIGWGYYVLLIPGVLCCAILNIYFAGYFKEQYQLLNKKQPTLDQYAMTLGIFNTMDGGQTRLLGDLRGKTLRAHREIRRLARIVDFFDRPLNPLVGLPLNLLFAYNIRALVALERWKTANKNDLPVWIDAVGRIECLNSLAFFAFNNPEYSYPLVQAPAKESSPGVFILAEQLAHPLLAKDRVANDLLLGEDCRIMLVTGSNMSGKTTFLRTVGVNLLLAQCGAPVCAARFSFTPMQILSSLRISDSLQENTSYFMAELKKLQQIVHRLKEGGKALVLVDEILRGTNSEDKTYGSEQFLLKLLQHRCIGLFATHDLSLGKLAHEKPGLVCNYCFESLIDQDVLRFDYRLQKGIARNKNASFLMQKMEII